MRRLFLFIPLILVVGFSLTLWRGLGVNPNNQDNAVIGRALPDYTLPDLMQPEKTVSLQSLRGKPLVLNVWASWCDTCRAEHPYLSTVAGLVPLYGISYRDKPEAARKWLAQSGNPYLAVLDDANGKLSIELGVYGTPETMLYSADGTLLARFTGELNADVWARIFQPRLAASVNDGKAAP